MRYFSSEFRVSSLVPIFTVTFATLAVGACSSKSNILPTNSDEPQNQTSPNPVLNTVTAGAGNSGLSESNPTAESNDSSLAKKDAAGVAAELVKGEFLRDGQGFSVASKLNSEALIASGQTPMDIDVQSYELSGFFDWESLIFHGEVMIDLRVASDAGNVLAIDSAVRQVTAVKLADGTALPFQIDHKNRKLIIQKLDLPQSSQVTGFELRFSVAYLTGAGTSLHRTAAGESDVTLYAVGPREDDPVKSRVYYSTAEPLGAASWMPCHNTPSDRAKFSTRFTMPSDERLISNGQLLQETVDQEKNIRTMAYATQYTLPTYLMAFAVGQFQVSQIQHGNLPLSVWSREGLSVDAGKVLEMVRSSVSQIEKLLVPFPFEKYAVVMLPQFPAGGIEHASITFQAENRSTEAYNVRDYGLTAHELAHQWFGDYVTVKTWDDLWIKEGMATLLAAEVTRPFEDQNGTGQFFGHAFGFANGEAIRDVSLAPNMKYTSGPYSRAAWFYTQLRAAAGNQVFWQTLSKFLNDNAFSSVSTEDLLMAFRAVLSDAQFKIAQSAVDAKEVPAFAKVEGGYRLDDPAGTLIVPLEFRMLSKTGTEDVKYIGNGQLLKENALTELAGGESVVVFDPQGVHPDLSEFGENAPSLVPKSMNVHLMQHVSDLGPVAAIRLLRDLQEFSVTKTDFDSSELQNLLVSMGSDQARYLIVQRICAGLEGMGEARETAAAKVLSLLELFPYRGQSTSTGLLRGCMTSDAQAQRMGELRSAAVTGESTSTELNFVQLFLAGQKTTRGLWERIATGGNSLRVRGAALSALTADLRELVEKGALEADLQLQTAWAGSINAVLGRTAVSENVGSALGLATVFAKVSPESGASLAKGFEEVLSKKMQTNASQRVLCAAQTVLGQETFSKVVQDVVEGPNGTLATSVLENPDVCKSE